MRSLTDKKGEQFGYLENNVLYDLDGVATGSLKGDFIVDLAGKRMWRVVGDGVYTLDSSESIGFFGSERRQLGRQDW
ncbi:MAG: hypothetical protein CSB13_06800 [Chloroflexi bacterium]|nr:MAG: hypothetical protein CSB13_06800 [Chloroflexota bacterium]